MAIEDDLLTAWRDGDTRAGDALIRHLFPPIRRFIASMVGGETEELVQQTFARMVEARTRWQGRSGARAFAFGIARNVLREHYRRRQRSEVDVEEVSVRDLAAGPSTLRWRRLEDERLLEGLRSLPLHMQIALELYYWEDFTAPEVAEILEIPLGTVASRIGRARGRLRDLLEGRTTPHDAVDTELDESSTEQWSARIRQAVPISEPDV